MLHADGGNYGTQGGKEKDRGHNGDETSKSRDMFAMSFHLLESGISKREVSGFWARGDLLVKLVKIETRRKFPCMAGSDSELAVQGACSLKPMRV